jgi:outer membrane protein OmpU
MNIKKIGLTALGTSLIATSAFAGAMDVTGSAGFTFAGADKYDTGNGFSMTDSLTFSGSGEMDNGWNVTVNMEVEANAQGGATTNNMDSRSLVIDMGDAGSLTFAGHGGSTAASAVDDVTPTAYGESWDVIGSTTATQTNGGTNKHGSIGGYGDDNIFLYTAPSMVDGLGLVVSFVPSHTDRAGSSMAWAVSYTGVEGLTLGYAMDNNGKDGTGATLEEIENTLMYVKYAYGPITVGYQENEADGTTASNDDEMTAYGITYAVSDDLSIGYNYSEIDEDTSTSTDVQESTNISFSYTMGSITIAGASVKMDNMGESSSAIDDRQGYEIDVSFAF